MTEEKRNLDDLCLNKEIAESQRNNEIDRGSGRAGTTGYELVGCYECVGYDKTCNYYITKKIIRGYNNQLK